MLEEADTDIRKGDSKIAEQKLNAALRRGADTIVELICGRPRNGDNDSVDCHKKYDKAVVKMNGAQRAGA